MTTPPSAALDAAKSAQTCPRRLFVTGAAGYVGRNLVRRFLTDGVEVVALARSSEAADRLQAMGAIAVVGSYSRSKIAAEKIALSMNDETFAVVVVRPRFVWGRDDTTALPTLVEAARSGQLAWIDGAPTRPSPPILPTSATASSWRCGPDAAVKSISCRTGSR